MKKSLLYLFFFFTVFGHSQFTLNFKDTISHNPSPYITVFNGINEIIGTSNELGEIYFPMNSKLTNSIFIESIFYEKKALIVKELTNNTTIFLTPKVNLLDEVNLDNKNKYAVLTAYYRNCDLVDDELIVFMDAEVKYVIKKNSIETITLNFRIFDTITPKNYKSYKYYWIPKLNRRSLFENLNSQFHLSKNEEDGFINIVGRENKELYGTVRNHINSKHNSNKQIRVLKSAKLFNGISLEEYNNEEILKTTIKDLKYRFEHSTRNIDANYIKSNPLLKGKKLLINKRELFIQSVEYITKEEYKKLKKKIYQDTSVSFYTKEFWENLGTFTPLDPSIEKQINTILIERK